MKETSDDVPRGKGRPRKERPETFAGHLGERIEAARKAKGWVPDDLAKKAKLGAGTVSRMERGEGSPLIENVLAVANALGLSGEQLLRKVEAWTRRPAG